MDVLLLSVWNLQWKCVTNYLRINNVYSLVEFQDTSQEITALYPHSFSVVISKLSKVGCRFPG